MIGRLRNPWFWANVWLACFWVGLSVGSGDYAIWMKYAAVSAGFSAVIFWLTGPLAASTLNPNPTKEPT